ncbi:hypothetical protein [Mycobacterium canetti]|uniref:hypothetical protein n=1 Tax=Mycobacterium canetti TaxID=78331 RepID=UPI0003452008|nr:hypothetical protein [Mycobacterium canetti]
MTSCPRCGYETRRKSWAQRHPAATAVIAVPTIYLLIGALLAYPWLCMPLLVVGAAWWMDRRNRRRAAIVARADHDHRELMARAVFTDAPQPQPHRRPAARRPGHVLTDWPTTPMTTRPMRRAV